jgi:hypothetical protein
VILLQDRFGPHHVVTTDNLPAYLDGRKGPGFVVGKSVRRLTPAGTFAIAATILSFSSNRCPALLVLHQ